MRRKDRQMPYEFALQVVDSAPFGTLALADGDSTYAVPLSFVRVDDRLYIHGASAGRKMTLLKKGVRYGISFVSFVQPPGQLSNDRIRDLVAQGESRQLLSRVFTTQYCSAHVEGAFRPVIDRAEKELALRALCVRYTPDRREFVDAALAVGLDYTGVFAFDRCTFEGKRKMLDRFGQEMKGGRAE